MIYYRFKVMTLMVKLQFVKTKENKKVRTIIFNYWPLIIIQKIYP